MATIKPELKEILDRYGINPRDQTQLWDCHGTLVLLHKAYEHIQAIENIQFDPPTIIEGCTEKKTVALLVVGHMKDKAEWSIGEASPANCKNAYPYAMAEKRAKDRVIGKLVGLAEHCHSEEEADDFKDGRPAQGAAEPAQQRKPDAAPKPVAKIEAGAFKVRGLSKEAGAGGWATACDSLLRKAKSTDELDAIMQDNDEALKKLAESHPDLKADVWKTFQDMWAKLEKAVA